MTQPLSNEEVLKVLSSRTDHTEISKTMKNYLEFVVKKDNKYDMTQMRKIKDIDPELL
jgi:hypothetical protein